MSGFIMRKRVIKTCISALYVHGWYVPLFLMLLGLKICLLSWIADSLKHRDMNYGTKENSHGKSLPLSSNMHKSSISSRGDADNLIPQLPDNLLEAEINPSDINRTSSSSIWLIYNAVPKSGDANLVRLIEVLADQNRYTHQQHDYQTPWPRFLLDQEQESLVSWFQYQHLPKSYNRHFFYVNFTKYQKYAKERPIYINVVRNPIDRLVMDYYSRRNMSWSVTKQEINRRNSIQAGSGTEWYHRTFEECVLQADPECRYTAGEKSFTLMTPFFCGQNNSCVVINDRWALQMAKFNIETEYSVVGALEKMDQTLTVLEKFVPRFFSGAIQLYNKLDRRNHADENLHNVSPYARQIMETELYNEVELYRFIVRRLALQFQKNQ